MYPALALSRILAVQPVLDAVERDQAAPRAAFEHLTIGQSLTGQVKSQAKGITLVEIEGQTVAMRLPHLAEVGDKLRLRFAGHMPQAVFLLEAEPAAADKAAQLSPTARMLSELVQRLPERNALPTLTPPHPLLDQPTVQTAEVALALRQALVRSGLFYESHLANWATGTDSLEGLLQEPQNRLAAAENARAAGNPAAAPANSGEAAGQKPLNPMLALLSQQLQVLESPQFAWRGELWPGQPLEWQVRQQADEAQGDTGASGDDGGGRAWESRLELTLPQLGQVSVHIRLDARQAFSIRLVPARPEVEALLQHNQPQLVAQLTAAGCALQSLTVEQDDADA